jgi:coenzyme F420-0:L-glutamate ligase/coenzyme F420-1:gamma-L-glutamate ligase
VTLDLLVRPVEGIREVRRGDDLPGLIAEAAGDLRDGDVVVVTQKVVSKAEGRVEPGPKDAWVDRESRRVVARRDDLVIAETAHGFVCASAGVDESNVEEGLVSLLPRDPDASASRIREGLRRRSGVDVGVVVSDTFGRPWRRGVVNVAIGCAGLPALTDLRGTPDMHGRLLEATVVAVADEVAAAAGLAMGKADRIPVAVVRGLPMTGAAGEARDIVRPPDEDLFRYAPLEAIESRRSIRTFGPGAVPRSVLEEAVRAALAAPVPHGSRHRSRPWTWLVLDSRTARSRLLDAMGEAWVRDLRADGAPEGGIERRLRRSGEVLGAAPVLAVPHVSLAGADRYPDDRRRQAERDMFVLATGASVQNFMLALHARGFATSWVWSSLFNPDEARAAVGLSQPWVPMGVVAVGPAPKGEPAGRVIDLSRHLRFE